MSSGSHGTQKHVNAPRRGLEAKTDIHFKLSL